MEKKINKKSINNEPKLTLNMMTKLKHKVHELKE